MNEATESPMALVDAYFKAVAENDLRALKELVSAGFVQHPPMVGVRQDRDAFIAEWRTRIDEDPDNSLVFEQSNRIGETVESGPRSGEWVHVWGTYRRTDNALAFKLSASFRVAGNHITEIDAHFDRLDIMTQAGFALTPPQ